MRLHKLDVEGFGPFRDRQSVDFDAFADEGIFLIAGRTGAGKSSILDAVCFGLYGGVPRYESGEKRLRSDHCEPADRTEVRVEFSTVAGRYRVTRSPEYLRPAKRGGGMTKEAATAVLEEFADGAWTGRAARAVDVAHELEGILQLSMQQFLQVILLAQNRFAKFLLADSKERQALLRKLFGTERFEDYQRRFEERRRAAEQSVAAHRTALGMRLDEAEALVADEERRAVEGAGVDQESGAEGSLGEAPVTGGFGSAEGAENAGERLEMIRQAQVRLEYRAERRAADRDAAEAALAAADAALSALREEKAAQGERDRARAALAALEEDEPRIAGLRSRLVRARAAENLRPVLTLVRRETAARDSADADVGVATRAAEEQGLPVEKDPALLHTWIAEQTRESGVWREAAETERELPALRAAEENASASVDRARQQVQRDEDARAALPALLIEATEAVTAARQAAERAAELHRQSESARERAEAAADAERLRPLIVAEERALHSAGEQTATEHRALQELRRRRLDAYAGELALALVDGEPCAVCGSTTHPHPAQSADPVSAEDVAAAESRYEEMATRERGLAEALATRRATLAAAEARAGGATAAEAEREAEAQQEAAVAAAALADDLPSRESALAELQRTQAAQEGQRAVAARELAAAEELRVRAAERLRDAEERVQQAKGSSASVADRLAEAEERIALMGALASALSERERRGVALSEALADREKALAASSFADADEAEAALLTEAEQRRIDEDVADHATKLEKERSILLDLELRMLPDEPILLAPAEQAASEAQHAWKAAVAEAIRAESMAERLAELVASATSDHERGAEEEAAFEALRALADTISGRGANTHRMNLETFVLAAELEEIVAAANTRLHDMSDGRYRLQHSDARASRGAASGLGIVVHDAFTGQTRPAPSLSGGETFLSSLALALGLAEVVTSRAGGVRLDTLFIDEGFGSLDAETLETAMRTLDELRQGGRTVGIISHVEAMQEQIPAQLTVRATASGPSMIEQGR